MRVAEHAIMVITTERLLPKFLQLMRAEYTEIPGLHPPKPRQRLWSLDPQRCALGELDRRAVSRKTRPRVCARGGEPMSDHVGQARQSGHKALLRRPMGAVVPDRDL